VIPFLILLKPIFDSFETVILFFQDSLMNRKFKRTIMEMSFLSLMVNLMHT